MDLIFFNVWKILPRKKQWKIREVSPLKYVLFHCAHTLEKNTYVLWNKSNGSYVIKDFGTLPLIFSPFSLIVHLFTITRRLSLRHFDNNISWQLSASCYLWLQHWPAHVIFLFCQSSKVSFGMSLAAKIFFWPLSSLWWITIEYGKFVGSTFPSKSDICLHNT